MQRSYPGFTEFRCPSDAAATAIDLILVLVFGKLADILAEPNHGVFDFFRPGVAKTQADEILIATAWREDVAGRNADAGINGGVEQLLCVDN